jgi:outer membrane receptor protein involved in Fe transport
MGWLSHHNEGDENVIVTASLQSAAEVDISIPIDRIPYQPERTGSIAATLTLPGGTSVSGQASYTGSMLIQQFSDPSQPTPPDAVEVDPPFLTNNTLLQEMQSTPGFWLVNLSVVVPIGEQFEIVAGGDNLSDRVQNDLDDPSTDFNWGPLAGRSWRLGLRYRLGP